MTIINISNARAEIPRPRIVTPRKGEVGDMCHEEQAESTDIRRIMRAYAGNLDEMMAWRSRPIVDYDDTVYPTDLQAAIETARDADNKLNDLAATLGITREQVMQVIGGDMSPLEKTNEVKDEKKSDKFSEVEKTVQADGE